VQRAFVDTTNRKGGAGEDTATAQPYDVVFRRRGTPARGPWRATVGLEGAAFFFSGTTTSWTASFGGRQRTLRLREPFFELKKGLTATEYSLSSSSFSCEVSDEVDLQAAETTIHNVCDLLSYATDVRVRLARVVVEDGTTVEPWLITLIPRRAPGLPSLPAIPLDHEYDGAAKVLLEHCVDQMNTLRGLYLI
jgi:hypothetical protein